MILTGGSRHGQPMPLEMEGVDTAHYVSITLGIEETYDARTGHLLNNTPLLGAPFAHYRPNRWDYHQITRPARVRASILANLPPGRPGRFIRAHKEPTT